MTVKDVLAEMTDEERTLYNSALQVKRSEFWKYYLEEVETIIEVNKEDLISKTMRGDTAGAMRAASVVSGLRLAQEKMEEIINNVDILALNQEQEEQSE